MTTTIETNNILDELIFRLNSDLEWRYKVRHALFPELDLPTAVQRLSDRQDELQHTMEQGFAEAKKERAILKQDVSTLKQDVGTLKGKALETSIYQKAPAVFGRHVRRGRVLTNDIFDHLHDAVDTGTLPEQALEQIEAVDLLWGGRLRKQNEDVVLVFEVSWKVAAHDLTRVVKRVEVLRQANLTALPVLVGLVWDEQMMEQARQQHVIMLQDMKLIIGSWENAASYWLRGTT